MVGRHSLRRERWTTDLGQVGNLGGSGLGEGGRSGGGGGLGEDGNHWTGNVDGGEGEGKEAEAYIGLLPMDERDVDRANPDPVLSLIGHEQV